MLDACSVNYDNYDNYNKLVSPQSDPVTPYCKPRFSVLVTDKCLFSPIINTIV